jgi:hypothetical protein
MKYIKFTKYYTEFRTSWWSGDSPASYSGVPGFKSWLWQQAILTEVFDGVPQSLQTNAGVVP